MLKRFNLMTTTRGEKDAEKLSNHKVPMNATVFVPPAKGSSDNLQGWKG